MPLGNFLARTSLTECQLYLKKMFFEDVSDYMKKTPSIKFIEKRATEAWQYLPEDLKLRGGTTAKSQNKKSTDGPLNKFKP